MPDQLARASTAHAAIDALYRDYGRRIVRLAYLLTSDAAVAEEVMQDAFCQLWRAWERLRDDDSAYFYLQKTVVNMSRSYLRRKKLEIRHRLMRLEDAVEIDVAGRIDVLRAVARLPHRQRACVALRFYEDLTESETAHVLGISIGTVKSQTFRALQRLEELMEGDERGA